MTVINMLSLDHAGLAVADEQSSKYFRKFNVSQKLQILNGSIVYGGSGPTDGLREIYDQSNARLREAQDQRKQVPLSEVHGLINSITTNYKNHLKNNLLNAYMGFGLNDLLTGTLSQANMSLDPKAMSYAKDLLAKFDSEFQMEILLGGMEDNGFSIYEVNSSGTGTKISRPYDSIGSGSDESEKVLSFYVSKLPREKREKIDKEEGLAKIIEATNSSAGVNLGVGGTNFIVYVDNEQIVIPNENQCILASELVMGATLNLLDREFAYKALSNLIFENGDFKQIEGEMRNTASNWPKLDRALRGFKE